MAAFDPVLRRRLLLLSFANFAIGMGAFVVIGLVTPVARHFAIDAATAGWMMTAYALVYAVASPLTVAATGAVDRRTVLLAGLGLFAAGAMLAAVAGTFGLLLAARALMAVGAGLVTPVGAAIAAGSVPAADRGRALSTAFVGLTLAQVVGVPAGAWIGYAFGWKAAFAVVGLLSLGAALLAARLPRGIDVPRASLAALGEVLRSGWRLLALSFSVLFLAGIYCVFTFVAPMLETRLGLGRDGVTAFLVVFGVGAVLGNIVGGRLTDRIGADRTLMLLCLAQAVLLPAVAGLTLPVVATGGLMLVWSICGWSFMAAQQARLAALDPPRTPVMFALNAAGVYVAAALGTSAGGAALSASGGFAASGIAGAAFVLAAAVTLPLVGRRRQLVKSR